MPVHIQKLCFPKQMYGQFILNCKKKGLNCLKIPARAWIDHIATGNTFLKRQYLQLHNGKEWNSDIIQKCRFELSRLLKEGAEVSS